MRVAISACLLGDAVRYDGGHKRHAWLADELGPRVEWVKVCPEVECGMGTPREPIHVVERDGRLRLLAMHSGTDFTDRMTAFASHRLDELAALDLAGYVLKSDSPSCDPRDGLFARALRIRFPDLPIEDEARLADPDVRERFVERMSAYRESRA